MTAVNISGGTVTAAAGAHAAGIGGTYNKAAGAVTISGGAVNATGGSYGAGLGAGETGTGGTVSITGGTVTATGGTFGPGIGAGYTGSFTSISITGGTVTATGGSNSAGLGGGWQADGVPVTIGAGADVTAAGAAGVTAVGGGTPASGRARHRVRIALGGRNADPPVRLGDDRAQRHHRLRHRHPRGNSGTLTLAGTIANTGSVVNHGTILVAGGTIDPAKVSDHNYLLTFDSASGHEQIQARVYAANLAAINQSAPAAPMRTGTPSPAGPRAEPAGPRPRHSAPTPPSPRNGSASSHPSRAPHKPPSRAPQPSARPSSPRSRRSCAQPHLVQLPVVCGWHGHHRCDRCELHSRCGAYDVELTVTVTPVLDGYDPSTGDGTSGRNRGGGILPVPPSSTSPAPPRSGSSSLRRSPLPRSRAPPRTATSGMRMARPSPMRPMRHSPPVWGSMTSS